MSLRRPPMIPFVAIAILHVYKGLAVLFAYARPALQLTADIPQPGDVQERLRCYDKPGLEGLWAFSIFPGSGTPKGKPST